MSFSLIGMFVIIGNLLLTIMDQKSKEKVIPYMHPDKPKTDWFRLRFGLWLKAILAPLLYLSFLTYVLVIRYYPSRFTFILIIGLMFYYTGLAIFQTVIVWRKTTIENYLITRLKLDKSTLFLDMIVLFLISYLVFVY